MPNSIRHIQYADYPGERPALDTTSLRLTIVFTVMAVMTLLPFAALLM